MGTVKITWVSNNAIAKFSGIVDSKTLLEGMSLALSNPDLEKQIYCINDLSEIDDLVYSEGEFKMHVAMDQGVSRMNPHLNYGIVVKEKNFKDASRYMHALEGTNWNIAIFTSLSDATKWANELLPNK